MPFTVLHEYFRSGALTIHVDTHDDLATVHCSMSGELPIRFPGKLIVDWRATYTVKIYVVDQSGRGKWQAQPTNETRKRALISPAAIQSASSECTNSTGHDLMTATSRPPLVSTLNRLEFR